MTHCLLVIDMQKGIFDMKQPVYGREDLIRSVRTAIRFARERGIPVIFTRHENTSFLKKGTEGYRIIDELAVLAGDTVIEKKHPDVFHDTGLDGILRRDRIDSAMVAGLISNGCVRAACLSALSRGYLVTLIGDAHSTFYRNAGKIIGDVNAEMEKAGAVVASADQLCEIVE